MKYARRASSLLALLLCASTYAQGPAEAVRIGVLTDLSGTYSDLSGSGTVAAVKMAVADFGGKVLGRPVEVLSADHQNKADIAANKAREWIDVNKVDVLMDFMDSASGLAAVRIAAQKNRIAIVNGAASTRFTNEECTPVTIHYTWDTYSSANGTGYAISKEGGDSWFFITADYAFGASLEKDAGAIVRANGGKVVGSVRHPLGAADFSSFVLQAQSSGAKVIGLANGGRDAQNSIKSAAEFGVMKSPKYKLAALAAFITDIRSLGLEKTQGIYSTEAFYWDYSDETRAWANRFFKITGKMPTAIQAGNYSSATQYLKAVQAAGTTDTETVMKKLKEMPINDFFAKNGRIREDGRMVHDMYLVQVKQPSESKGPWDIYKVKQVIPGDKAFQPLSTSRCPLVAAK
jgi:branched-chain amino acid transport system substrate-binding protein